MFFDMPISTGPHQGEERHDDVACIGEEEPCFEVRHAHLHLLAHSKPVAERYAAEATHIGSMCSCTKLLRWWGRARTR